MARKQNNETTENTAENEGGTIPDANQTDALNAEGGDAVSGEGEAVEGEGSTPAAAPPADAAQGDAVADAATVAAQAVEAGSVPAPAGMSTERVDDLSIRFGRVALSIMRGQLGDAAAVKFIETVVQPSMPGTPERKAQDKAFRSLTNRLKKA